jgi:Holliday junction resolvasome RuvABC endonuclease subunit
MSRLCRTSGWTWNEHNTRITIHTLSSSRDYGQAMKIAGIDLGKQRVSVVTYLLTSANAVQLKDVTTVLVHPTVRGQELHTLAKAVTGVSQSQQWDYAFIEEPLVGRGVKASMEISQTAGAIMASLAAIGTHIELINVQTWKMQIVGKGNAGKGDIRLYLDENHPKYAASCESQDEYDAACIGLFGVETIRRARAITAPVEAG